ncbi:hypothetical protein AWP54_21500 [Escherichia coli]|uniref:CopG family ribbon-helix-helix protein n=4 Tax=Enterobacterales TaxID=91347 RepID=UPI0009426349|nr:hypothetical protein AWP54_21500 [Escherichia coli]
MAQVNMSLRIDAELKDAFMAAAKSMDRNGSQLIRDFMRQTVERQHNTWFRDQVEAGRQQLYRWVPSAPKCTANNAGWNDKAVQEIVRIPITVLYPGQEAHDRTLRSRT